MTGRRTTHFARGGQAACVERIRPPWLSADTRRTDCKSCLRTDAYLSAVLGARAHPADVPLLLEWLRRAS